MSVLKKIVTYEFNKGVTGQAIHACGTKKDGEYFSGCFLIEHATEEKLYLIGSKREEIIIEVIDVTKGYVNVSALKREGSE